MDKLIVFDWGGVIERHHGNGRTADESWIAVMRRLGASDDDYTILQNIYRTGYMFDILTVTDQRIFEEFAIKLCICCDIPFPGLQSFLTAYYAEFDKTDYYQDMIDLIQGLRGRCRLGLLSNTLLPDKVRIESRIPLSIFNYTWLSSDTGASKHSMIRSIESVSGISPQDILLIDNNPVYIGEGLMRSWNVHLFQEYDAALAAVEKFL